MKTIEETELLSWKSIWLAVEEGKQHFVQKAINEHVERHPPSERDEVRLRTIHIVRHNQRNRAEIRQRIRRVSHTIRTLQKGCYNPNAQEPSHAS